MTVVILCTIICIALVSGSSDEGISLTRRPTYQHPVFFVFQYNSQALIKVFIVASLAKRQTECFLIRFPPVFRKRGISCF